MAIKRIYAEKDASIGNKPVHPGMEVYKNEGKDEILEIGKFADQYGTVQEKRILVKFPTVDVSQTLAQISGSYTVTLNLKHCSVRGVLRPRSFSIQPISGSWEEGIGKKYDTLPNQKTDTQTVDYIYQEEEYVEEDSQEYILAATQTKGVNWVARTNDESSLWITPGGDTYPSQILYQYPSQELELDFSVDVTSLIGTTPEGFLIKIAEDYVGESYLHHFYSKDTHTIYQPYLDIKWRDQEWTGTGIDLPARKDYSIELSPQVLDLYPNQDCTLYVTPKVKYPVRVFSTSSLYLQSYRLPSSSMWRIVDENANNTVVDFDPEYTLLHANENGNYLKFNTSLLEPERYYRVEIKVPENGTFRILDTKIPFKLK